MIRKESIPSTLENFQPKELDILNSYIGLIKAHEDFPEILLYNYARVVRTQELTKQLVYYEIFKKIIEIPGDIIEIGVLEGQSLFSFAHFSEIYEHRNYTRKILGFDDFEGYSLPNGHFIKASSFHLLEQSVALFNKAVAFNQFEKIKIVKGNIVSNIQIYVEESHPVCALFILHKGLYEIDKEVLQTLYPRIPKGGIILTGSFAYEKEKSCTQIVDDIFGIQNLSLRRFPFATKYCYFIKD